MIWVNIETRVFHSTPECSVAQRTSEHRIQRQDGDGSLLANGLRCRVCYDWAGDPR